METGDELDKLNDGHILEALDRLFLATRYLEMSLSEHPLLNAVHEFKTDIENVIDTLGSLYQKVGQLDSASEISKLYKLSNGEFGSEN